MKKHIYFCIFLATLGSQFLCSEDYSSLIPNEWKLANAKLARILELTDRLEQLKKISGNDRELCWSLEEELEMTKAVDLTTTMLDEKEPTQTILVKDFRGRNIVLDHPVHAIKEIAKKNHNYHVYYRYKIDSQFNI